MSLMAELDEETGIIETLDIGGVLDPYRNEPAPPPTEAETPAYMPSAEDYKSRAAKREARKKSAKRRGRYSTTQPTQTAMSTDTLG